MTEYKGEIALLSLCSTLSPRPWALGHYDRGKQMTEDRGQMTDIEREIALLSLCSTLGPRP
jgi:hypothetical protein